MIISCESIDSFEDIYALGAGNAASHDVDSRYGIGKCSANVGEKRRGREGGDDAKLLILLVELARIELATS
jgi:hypothetical protein